MFRISQKSNNNVHEDTPFKKYDAVDQLKKQLIDYIFSTIDLSRFKFDTLKYESELPQLLKQKYFVSANFTGANCLLVFTKIKDKYYSYLIDRKTLSYNVSKIDVANVKTISARIQLDPSVYLGTIFDGIYVQNKDEKLYIITDVYCFKGQDYTNTQLDSKLLSVFTYLKSNYDESNKSNTVVLTVNKLYDFTKTDHLVHTVIPSMKDMLVKGICFYPQMSGTKIFFLFGNETRHDDIVEKRFSKTDDNMNKSYQRHPMMTTHEKPAYVKRENVVSDVVQNVKMPHKVSRLNYIPKKGKIDTDYTFEMKKAESVDVYILNIVEPVIKEGSAKPLYKRKKVGIAYVPDISKSKWCSETMVQNHCDTLLVNCKYHNDKNKWEPIRVSTSKRPNSINDFDIKPDS